MYSNSDLMDYLINIGALHSSNIIDAFLHVDRADFVAYTGGLDTYGDYPLPIGWGQTISQLSTVAMMLEMLAPKRGDKILDIGSGSGWTAVLLADIAKDEGSVTGVERVDELVDFGNKNLKKYKLKNAKIIHAQENLGIQGEIFDRILVSAAANEFPADLTKQLKVGAKMVIPVRNSIYEITKQENAEFKIIEHYGFIFVPLIQ